MKIYLASSWRNHLQAMHVAALREAGFDVYDFRNPEPGNTGFRWTDVALQKTFTTAEYHKALTHPIAEKGFALDYGAMKAADAGVLLLPSGRSAHIEAGYFVGAGKPLFIIGLVEEPELMYKMATKICTTVDSLIHELNIAKENLK